MFCPLGYYCTVVNKIKILNRSVEQFHCNSYGNETKFCVHHSVLSNK